MGKWYFKKITIYIVSFVLTLVMFNILSYFYIRYHLNSSQEFKSWNKDSVSALWGTLNWDRGLKYHPYWGYREESEEPMDLGANSEFIVRIVGGSFASDIGRYAVRNPEAIKALVTELRPGIDPQKITVINSAHAGFHQPQQLHLVVDLVSDTDLFISYEGFNELMHEWTSCSPRNWPLLSQFRFDPVFRDAIPVSYAFYTKSFKFLMDWKDWSLINFIFYKVGPTLHQGVSAQNKYALSKLEESCESQSVYPDDSELVSDWIEALRTQRAVVESQKKRIFVFIQPNQYIEGSKERYSDQEIALFKFQSSDLKRLTNRRFQYALSEMESEGHLEGTVIDLTKIFATETESIYLDSCCHINQKGHKLVYEKSLGIIRKKLGLGRSKRDEVL